LRDKTGKLTEEH